MMPIAATTPPTAQPRKRSSTHHAAWLLAAAACTLPMWGTLGNAHSQTTAAQRNSGRVPFAVPGQAKPHTDLYEGSYALVIGASAYRNGWKPLPGVKNDIPAVKAALEKHGFKVQVVQDPTRDQLDAALRNFVAEHGQKEGNRLLVYFAGHGESLDARTGSKLGYIVPVDAPLPQADMAGFKRVAYSMDAIEGHARQMDAKHALFVFDSCFSGTIFAKRANTPDSITDKTSRPVRQFITSGDAGQTVPDESLFRKRFVRALLDGDADLNRDTYITGSELGSYLEDSVTNDSRRTQTPRHGKIMREDLDQGDFVFASLRVEPSWQPPTRPPLPGPAQGGGLNLDDLKREEENRKAWAQWQARMKADYDKTAAFEGSADLQAKAWERFLAAWGQDNPLSGEDEGLRAQAQGRMQERQQAAQRLATAVAATPTPQPATATTTTLDGRYQILAGGAEVKDLTTGLVWQRCSVGQQWDGQTCAGEASEFTFDQAQNLSRDGWRVPSKDELVSLVDESSGANGLMAILANKRSSIHAQAFPAAPLRCLWTSTPNATDARYAWRISFYDGDVTDGSHISHTSPVRLVR